MYKLRKFQPALRTLIGMIGLLAFAQLTLAQGNPVPDSSALSNQKVGSVLFYNFYSSISAEPEKEDTDISITNTHPSIRVMVRFFFINGADGQITAADIHLNGRQTISVLASDLAADKRGYIVAVTADEFTGCPKKFNFLAGDAYVKLKTGHAANLNAEAFAAIADPPAVCSGGIAALNFDGISYNRMPRVLAVDNITSRGDGNDTLVIINRFGGNLAAGFLTSTIGSASGVLFDNAANSYSFTFTGGVQLVDSLTNVFPRTTPRFETLIPSGSSGWMKLFADSDVGILGATLILNANTASSLNAFNSGRNLHKLTLSSSNTLIIPTICSVITIQPATLPPATRGMFYSQTLTAVGSTLPTFNVSPLPMGLSLSGDTISGTPTVTGSFPITVTVTDIRGCTSVQNYVLTITCQGITVDPATLPSGTAGARYSAPLFTASGGFAPYTFSRTGVLPTGMAFNNGVLSGIPTQTGNFDFTVTATDANGCAGSRDYSLTIDCPRIAVNPASLPNATTGTPYSIPLSVFGGISPYSFGVTSGSLPPGITLSRGRLLGTPTQAGTFFFTITATDANGCQGSTIRLYSLTVVCPIISITPATLPPTVTCANYNQPLTASGGTAPYVFTAPVNRLPPGIQLIGNQLTGSPTQVGSFSFDVIVIDANGCRGTISYGIDVSQSFLPSLSITPGGLDFGLNTPFRTTNPSAGTQDLNIGNTSCQPVLITQIRIERTGSEVASGKITGTNDLRDPNTPSDRRPFVVKTPMFVLQPGETLLLRLIFDPLIPGRSGTTGNLDAFRVMPELITSQLSFFALPNNIANLAVPFTVPIQARLTSAVRLIHPTDPAQPPLIKFECAGDQFTVEASIYDPKLDLSLVRYEFMDSDGNVVQTTDVDEALIAVIQNALRSGQLVRGQSFGVIQKFSGALDHRDVTKVKVTVYGRETNETAISEQVVCRNAVASQSLSEPKLENSALVLPALNMKLRPKASGVKSEIRPQAKPGTKQKKQGRQS